MQNKYWNNNYYLSVLSFFCISFLSLPSQSSPFEECPTNAFLVQDNVAKIYGVSLATGSYVLLSDNMGTTGKLNSVGFNTFDRYIYGFGYESGSVVRIGSDYQVTALEIQNMPGQNFFIGDISIDENALFLYRKNSENGLYKVSLEFGHPEYLNLIQVGPSHGNAFSIFDVAFHPSDGYMYSLDKDGKIIKINPNDGSYEELGSVSETGTFGAVYFDANGYLYASRNADGHLFRIDVNAGTPTAEIFAFGPASSNNDGARCANAPLVDENSDIDFGDAPDTYGTSLINNGARHDKADIWLGSKFSGTDDGVDILTGVVAGEDTLINTRAIGNGAYLNVWADWNQNGTFESSEQVITDRVMSWGDNFHYWSVPTDAAPGSTWTRVRYSRQAGVGPTGGVSDGEVEDYQVVVTVNGITVEHYPSSAGFTTLAFEDNWPQIGDFDMNDVVIAYRTRRYRNNSDQVIRYDIEGSLMAIGGSYHSGFAVQLDNIATSNVNENSIRFEYNGEWQLISPLELNAPNDDAVLIVTEDLWEHVAPVENCGFYRTEAGCESIQQFKFLIIVPLLSPVDVSTAPENTLNPFIFATPGRYHGAGYASAPGRSKEIHLKNMKTTVRFDQSVFGRYDDMSDSQSGVSFVNSNSMPWAMSIPGTWSHPLERTDISAAYPDFPDFVTSGGSINEAWYDKTNSTGNTTIDNENEEFLE